MQRLSVSDWTMLNCEAEEIVSSTYACPELLMPITCQAHRWSCPMSTFFRPTVHFFFSLLLACPAAVAFGQDDPLLPTAEIDNHRHALQFPVCEFKIVFVAVILDQV